MWYKTEFVDKQHALQVQRMLLRMGYTWYWKGGRLRTDTRYMSFCDKRKIVFAQDEERFSNLDNVELIFKKKLKTKRADQWQLIQRAK